MTHRLKHVAENWSSPLWAKKKSAVRRKSTNNANTSCQLNHVKSHQIKFEAAPVSKVTQTFLQWCIMLNEGMLLDIYHKWPGKSPKDPEKRNESLISSKRLRGGLADLFGRWKQHHELISHVTGPKKSEKAFSPCSNTMTRLSLYEWAQPLDLNTEMLASAFQPPGCWQLSTN